MQGKENTTLRGAAYVITCMFVLGLGDNLVRFFSGNIGVFQFHFMRSLLVLCIVLVGASILKQSVWPKSSFNVAVRSTLYALAMIAYFASLDSIPVAHAAAALFTAPLFMVIFEAILTKSRVGPYRVFAVLLGFAGVLVILRPFGDAVSPFVLLPLGGAVFYALGLLATRSLCGEESLIAMVFGQFASLVILGGFGVLFTTFVLPSDPSQANFLSRGWAPITGVIVIWMMIQAVFATTAMTTQTKGYQLAPASLMSIFEYSFLIFASIWGVIIWNDGLGLYEYLGMAMIAAAGCIIALRSRD